MHAPSSNELTAIRPAMTLVVRHGVPAVSAALAALRFDGDPAVSAAIVFATTVFLLLSGGVDVDAMPRLERRFAYVVVSACAKALGMTMMFCALLLWSSGASDALARTLHFAMVFVPAMACGSLAATWLALHPALRARRRRVAIVGVTEASLRFAQTLSEDPFVAAEFVGFFDDRDTRRPAECRRVPMLGRIATMRRTLDAQAIDEVFIALPMAGERRMGEIMEQLLDTAVSVHFLPDFVAFKPIHEGVGWVKGIPVYTVIGRPDMGLSGAAKRAFDVICASLGLALLSPMLLLVAAAIKLESPGPVLFRQIRHGADGRTFPIYKFRSMTTAACASNEVVQATRNDMRVTRLGRFLRRSSIDELPQLFNVLRGEMSLVGPRPHAAQHNEQYRRQIRGYMLRHKVRPGLTGWAQVHGLRGETETVEKMANRVRFDLDYLRHWSVGLDLYIVLRTFRQLAKGV